MREMSKEEVSARWPEPTKATPDYAEILRIWKKYSKHEKEPLHAVFVRVGQALEKVQPGRCPSCLYTNLVYSRLVYFRCEDPFHAEPGTALSESPTGDGDPGRPACGQGDEWGRHPTGLQYGEPQS